MTAMQESAPRPAPRRSPLATGRARLAIAAVSIVAAIVGVVLAFTLTGSKDTTADSVVATLRVPGMPNAIVAGSDALWVGLTYGPDQPRGKLVRLDLATGSVQKTVNIEGIPTASIRVGDSLWQSQSADGLDTEPGEFTELDWNTGEILGRLTFDRPVFGLAGGDGSLWLVVGRTPATVVRVDPATRQVIGKPITVSQNRVIGLAFGEGAVWATAFEDGMLVRVDPKSGRVDTVKVGDDPVGVVVADGLVWVANRGGGTVTRVDAKTMQIVGDPIDVGNLPTWIGAVAGSVWVANQADGTVIRIDEETGKKVGPPIRIAPPAENDAAAHAVSVAGGSLWVTSLTEQTVSRIDPSR